MNVKHKNIKELAKNIYLKLKKENPTTNFKQTNYLDNKQLIKPEVKISKKMLNKTTGLVYNKLRNKNLSVFEYYMGKFLANNKKKNVIFNNKSTNINLPETKI